MGTIRAGFIGDLHFTDRQVGKYEDYFAMCQEIGARISDTIIAEGLTHLFIGGDIVGVSSGDNTMKTHTARLWLIQLFAQWSQLLNGNLYTIRGNHDGGASTCDFDLLIGSMLVKHCDMVDVGAYRIHMFDYGADDKVPNIDSEKINVALMHSHFTVENKTNFIPFQGGVELSDMANLKDCDIVVCGHIHNPSLGYIPTNIQGNDVMLIYPGCPTRAKASDNWDKTSMLVLETNEENGEIVTEQKIVTFNLQPKAELLKETIADGTIQGIDENEENITNIEDLERILNDLNNFQIGGTGSYKEQLERLAGLNKPAADLAMKYIEKAEALGESVK